MIFKSVLAQLKLQNLQNNLFTKQIPSHVRLQAGTNQRRSITKKMLWWSYFRNSYKDYYKKLVPRNYFVGQDGTEEFWGSGWGSKSDLRIQFSQKGLHT